MNISYNNTSTTEVNGFGKTIKFEPVAPNLWWIHNTFDLDTLKWMKNIYLNTNNTFNVSRPNKRLLLAKGKDNKKLYHIGLSLIPTLNDMLNINLNLMLVKFWFTLVVRISRDRIWD